MDRALAESGLLVVAIDMTLAPEAPYPASVQDASYGERWLKWKAASWNGDALKLGIYGSSSGGHIAELLAMRPRDARYNAIPLAEAPALDAAVAYVSNYFYASADGHAAQARRPLCAQHADAFAARVCCAGGPGATGRRSTDRLNRRDPSASRRLP